MRILRIKILVAIVTWGHFNACSPSDDIPVESEYMIGGTHVGIETVASDLDVPWQLVWGPDDHIWFTEQGGEVSKLDPLTGKITSLLVIDDVLRERTSGLLGMALHPDWDTHPYVFLNYSGEDNNKNRYSRVVRYTYKDDALVDSLVILEYPAWRGHFGARVVIAPDGKLMIATGDGAQFENAQSLDSPNGKILRYNTDGTIPDDNLFPGSAVWAWGLRNPQGIVYANGELYNSDHGDATDDEVNLIKKGANYGWPFVEGYIDNDKEADFASDTNVTEPMKAWTPTIAPAGMAYYHSDKIPELERSLLLTTLKGNSLRALKLDPSGTKIVEDVNYFQQVFGRLRSVCVSPDGDIYIATSNRDWNPNAFPDETDDRIIRIFRMENQLKPSAIPTAVIDNATGDVVSRGEELYISYCASCHGQNGRGLEDLYPPLVRSPMVTGEQQPLIQLTLNGLGDMPTFNFLDDRDIAVVLTYIRRRFGPQASTVSESTVAAARTY